MNKLISAPLRISKLFRALPLFCFASYPKLSSTLSTSLIHTNKFFFTATSSGQIHENVSKSQFVGEGFYVQQLLTGCLAIFSYYIQSGNQAFLIDPMNETDKYENILKQRGKTLKGVFLTHYHADYIAGHLDLKKKFNCEVYLGPKALNSFGIKVLKDGEQLSIGQIKLRVIHTPGHTQESSCMLLIDKKNEQQALFTGDTIFLNEVGRPDLAVKTNLSSADLAGMLFDSLQKVKTLNDKIRIYPGHGSGSSCGKSIGKGDFCSLSTQKINNYALKQTNKQKFVKDVLDQMPAPPQYFGYNAGVNKFKPFNYEEAHENTSSKILGSQLRQIAEDEKAVIIDVRAKNDLKSGIIKGSIAIDFDGAFANWVGTLLSHKGKYIIYGQQQRAKQSIKRLLRVGYINILGYCSDSIQSFPGSEVYVPDFVPTINLEDRIILDIRKPTEWEKGIAAGNVIKYEIGDLFKKDGEGLDKNKKYVVHCQSGYRARIAYSYLKNKGFDVKVYGDGGFPDFEKLGVKTRKND